MEKDTFSALMKNFTKNARLNKKVNYMKRVQQCSHLFNLDD